MNSTPLNKVGIMLTARHILLKLPKSEPDLAFLRSLQRARWDSAAFCWVLPRHPNLLESIKAYFNERLLWQQQEEESGQALPVAVNKSDKLLKIVRYHNGRIRLMFRFDAALITLIKTVPMSVWDAGTRSWSVPHTESILRLLKDFCSTHQWQYEYFEDIRGINRKPRPLPPTSPTTATVRLNTGRSWLCSGTAPTPSRPMWIVSGNSSIITIGSAWMKYQRRRSPLISDTSLTSDVYPPHTRTRPSTPSNSIMRRYWVDKAVTTKLTDQQTIYSPDKWADNTR